MKTKLIMVAMCILLIPSCQTTNPKNDLLFAQNAFLRTVNSLTILRDAGKFDEGEIIEIKALISTGDRLLDIWTDAVLEGKEIPPSDVFETILLQLIAYKEKPNE